MPGAQPEQQEPKQRPPNYKANKKAAKVLAKKFIQKVKKHIHSKMEALNDWTVARTKIRIVIDEKYTLAYRMEKISLIDGNEQGELVFMKHFVAIPKVIDQTPYILYKGNCEVPTVSYQSDDEVTSIMEKESCGFACDVVTENKIYGHEMEGPGEKNFFENL